MRNKDERLKDSAKQLKAKDEQLDAKEKQLRAKEEENKELLEFSERVSVAYEWFFPFLFYSPFF